MIMRIVRSIIAGLIVFFGIALINSAFAGEKGKLIASGGNPGLDRADLYEGACFAPAALANIASQAEEIAAMFGFTPEPNAAVYIDEKTNDLMDGCWFLAPGSRGPGSVVVVMVWEDGAVAVVDADYFEGAEESPQSK